MGHVQLEWKRAGLGNCTLAVHHELWAQSSPVPLARLKRQYTSTRDSMPPGPLQGRL